MKRSRLPALRKFFERRKKRLRVEKALNKLLKAEKKLMKAKRELIKVQKKFAGG